MGGPGRWPGRARVLALGCCAGPHGRVIAGNILSEVTALSGRADPWWVLAGDWQVPSESVARRSRHVRRFEWRVGPMCRADCGQWWPAKLCVQLGRSKSVSAPRGHCGPRCPVWFAEPSPGPGDFPQARRGPPAESAVKAGLGRGVAGAYVGALVRPAAGRQYSGDWGPVQPAVGGLSTADCSGWVSESAFLRRKPLKDSSSWMRGLPQRLVPRWRRRSRVASLRPSQFSGPCLSSRKFQSHGGVQAPRRG